MELLKSAKKKRVGVGGRRKRSKIDGKNPNDVVKVLKHVVANHTNSWLEAIPKDRELNSKISCD